MKKEVPEPFQAAAVGVWFYLRGFMENSGRFHFDKVVRLKVENLSKFPVQSFMFLNAKLF